MQGPEETPRPECAECDAPLVMSPDIAPRPIAGRPGRYWLATGTASSWCPKCQTWRPARADPSPATPPAGYAIVEPAEPGRVPRWFTELARQRAAAAANHRKATG